MPDEARHWMGRVKDVEREFRAIRLGTERLLQIAREDPAALGREVRHSDIASASENLEGTYLIRLFAEFEKALRTFLRHLRLRMPGTTEALINRTRDRGRIPQESTEAVHRVREHRNDLLHERSDPVESVTIREATQALCSFLSRLERIW